MRRFIERAARGALLGVSLFAAAWAPTMAAAAESAITVIVPTPPGGPVDRVSRIVAQALATTLARPVVVDNKVGAAGKIGVQAALRLPRDGRTLVAVSPSIVSVNPVLDKAVGFDPLGDFDHLGIVASSTGVLAARADLPATDMASLVAYAKANPGALTYGSFGIGTSLHLQSEELLHTLGITARHVPYKGEAQTLNALVSGEIDMMASVTTPVVPFVNTGRVRALAVTGSSRWPALPNVPSFAETGIPALRNYAYRSWVGFVLPSGTPPAERSRLAAALAEALGKAETRSALEAQGFEPIAPRGDEMRSTIAAELQRNRRVIAASGITLE